MEKITEYVVGFLFSADFSKVVLIQKERPDWQKGLLNGVGGHVEPAEAAMEAIEREFEEETGVQIIESWIPFAEIKFPKAMVSFFYFNSDKIETAKTITDEHIVICQVSDLPNLKTIPNLQWLIPMCLDGDHEYAKITGI